MFDGLKFYALLGLGLLALALGGMVYHQNAVIAGLGDKVKLVERQRDEARADLAVSAANAQRMLDEKDQVIASLAKRAAEERGASEALSQLKAEIARVADSTACRSSPPVRAVLDGLRAQARPDHGQRHNDPVPAGDDTGRNAALPLRAGGASRDRD